MNNLRAPLPPRAAMPWRILLPLLLALCALPAHAGGPGMAPCGEHPSLQLRPPALGPHQPPPLYLDVLPPAPAQSHARGAAGDRARLRHRAQLRHGLLPQCDEERARYNVRGERARHTVPGRLYGGTAPDQGTELELQQLDVYQEAPPENIALPLESGANTSVWVRRAVYTATVDQQPVQTAEASGAAAT